MKQLLLNTSLLRDLTTAQPLEMSKSSPALCSSIKCTDTEGCSLSLFGCSPEQPAKITLMEIRVVVNTRFAAAAARSATVNDSYNFNKARCNCRQWSRECKHTLTPHINSDWSWSMLSCQNRPPAMLTCLKHSPQHIMEVSMKQHEHSEHQPQLQTMMAAPHSSARTFVRSF